MDLTLNFSSDPLKSESELESSLKEPEFISKIPDLVIFPEIINFKNIIVGTTAHQKIILTNSSAEQKEITISINADPSFQAIAQNIIIPGEGYSTFIISFSPKFPGSFTGTLLLTESSDFYQTFEIHGNCIPSPLQIPHQNDPIWTFSLLNQECINVLISNNGLTSLIIQVQSNSPYFIPEYEHLSLSPQSQSVLPIIFKSELKTHQSIIKKQPIKITFKCESLL